MGVKKSDFTALTAIADAATLDFVIDGQNFKIAKSDFLAALGVTGTINQAGDPAGTPVLDGSGTDFLIRNLEDGAGVRASVSPQNGITLDHNFTQATTGVAVLGDPLATSPIIRSIAAATGATVELVGDAIVIGLGAGQAIPADIVFVQSETDFPVPVGGISTLEEKTYLLAKSGDIPVSFRLKYAFGRTVITGLGQLVSTLQLTATSSLANIINDAGISMNITDAFIESPNAPMFGGVGGANAIFTLSNCVVDNCADLGQIDGFVRTAINNGTLIGFNVTGGLKILGTSPTVLIQDVQSAANNATPTFIMDDAGLSINDLNIANVTASLLTGSNQFAEIDPTKITGGLVADSSFSTASGALGAAIDNATPNIIVDRVRGIQDTRKLGSASRAPGLVTIVTQSVPVEIGGSWLGANLSQFSALNPGIEYDGASGGDIFKISATVSGSKAGATGSDIYTCAIYINDVLVADSLSISEISDKGGSFFMDTFTTLDNLDHITLYLSNEDSTENFNLTEAKISVNRVN